MSTINALTFSPGPTGSTVRAADGRVLTVPDGWALLPPGDAGLTRRVKAAGPTWTVQEKNGRKVFSRGVWAPASTIEKVRAELVEERGTETYAKRRAADSRRRESKQTAYVDEFRAAVSAYLSFHDEHFELVALLAAAVAAHATPVGSGTVARTQRIPVERRAEAAVIAWLRHQTTAYDNMPIARVKGKRREVRRALAQESKRLLDKYRRGERVPSDQCLLRMALSALAPNHDSVSRKPTESAATVPLNETNPRLPTQQARP